MTLDTPGPPVSTGRDVASRVPSKLRRLKRWITWRLSSVDGKPTKRPAVSVRERKSWDTLDAFDTQPVGATGGVGFVFTGGVALGAARLIGLDIDACFDAPGGELRPWAREILDAFPGAYTEVSPSGTGLRVLVPTHSCPSKLATIKIEDDPVDGKRPNVQFFGVADSATYVTVTGDVFEGRRNLPEFESVDWIMRRYPTAVVSDPTPSVPIGTGSRPSLDQIGARIAKNPEAAKLAAGGWADLGYPSSSEGFTDLVRSTLRAAHGHGDLAIEFLLSRTKYGAGEVGNHPEKYTKRAWVAGDVARLASMLNERGASVFEDAFDPDEWSPPEPPPRPDGLKWLETPRAAAKRLGAQRWLARGLLPDHGLAELVGASGTGKSTIAVSLAAHVAAARDRWFGLDVERAGRVIYIAGEGQRGVVSRFGAMARVLGDPGMLGDGRIMVSRVPAALSDVKNVTAWLDEFREWLKLYPGEPPALVVVDTLFRNFGGGDENSAEDMARFVEGCDRIARVCSTLVLVVHHTGHMAKTRGRGSSAWFGALDASLLVSVDPRRPGVVLVTPAKSKDTAVAQPFAGLLRGRPSGETDDQGQPVSAAVFDPGDAVFEVTDELEEMTMGGLHIFDVLRAIRDNPGVGVRKTFPNAKSAANRLQQDACARGWVSKTGPRGSYELTRAGLLALPHENEDEFEDLFEGSDDA